MNTIFLLWIYVVSCTAVGPTMLKPGWIMTNKFKSLTSCNIVGTLSGQTYKCAELGIWPPAEELARKAGPEECVEA